MCACVGVCMCPCVHAHSGGFLCVHAHMCLCVCVHKKYSITLFFHASILPKVIDPTACYSSLSEDTVTTVFLHLPWTYVRVTGMKVSKKLSRVSIHLEKGSAYAGTNLFVLCNIYQFEIINLWEIHFK